MSIGSKSAISLQRGPVDPKFHVEGVTHNNHSSQKTRLNGLSYGIKNLAMHAFDGHLSHTYMQMVNMQFKLLHDITKSNNAHYISEL